MVVVMEKTVSEPSVLLPARGVHSVGGEMND